jgi:signal transduction histidine kinase
LTRYGNAFGEAEPPGATVRAEARQVPQSLLVGLIVAIGLADAIVPAGIVVSVLLVVPVLLSSTLPFPRHVLRTGVLALLAKILADLVTAPSVIPLPFWVANRVLAYLLIAGSIGLALLLQRLRLADVRARRQAEAALSMNRLLMSLLAHDLRAPLIVAGQCIGYVRESLDRGAAPDPALLAETGGRLERSLRAIDIVLSVARAELEDPASRSDDTAPVPTGALIEQEVDSFAEEGALYGKRVVSRLGGIGEVDLEINPGVVRQTLRILIDNAIRYAAPGEVTVRAEISDGTLRIDVSDPGPRSSGAGGEQSPRGAGLVLELSRALLAHAGGTLTSIESANGTVWSFTVPARHPPVPNRSPT